MDAGALSRLIEAVYDCAVDPALWPGTLERIADALDSAAATVNVVDFVTGAERTLVYVGITEEYQALYRARYHCTNLFLHGMLLRPIDEPATSDELVSEEELLGSRVYREWAAPQGFRHVMLVALMRTQARLAFLGVTRTARQTRYAAADKALMELIAPHVRRAVTIADLIDHKDVSRNRFAGVVDALATAVLVLNGSGRLVHANTAGEALIARGDALVACNGVVEPWDTSKRGALLARRDGAAHPEARTVALPRRGGGIAVASVLPLASDHRRNLLADPSHVAVFVQDTAAAPNAVETVGRLFRLTGAELRVLLGLAEGASTRAIAQRYGIAPSTVRTHLKSLFEKTGTHRQKDLVSVLFAVPPVRAQGSSACAGAAARAGTPVG